MSRDPHKGKQTEAVIYETIWPKYAGEIVMARLK